MNTTAALVWALWITGGGWAHSGYFVDSKPVAYFQTVEECRSVQDTIVKQWDRLAGRTKCIQSRYIK